MKRQRIKYGEERTLRLHSFQNEDGSELLLLRSPALAAFPALQHGFSTRFGGVSEGCFESMNLSFSRGDSETCVRENFRRIAACFGQREDRFVLSFQTHTANVRAVTEADLGKGVTRLRDYTDVDALITDRPGIILGVFWADCVPILFYDPVRQAIGAAHSGWRGTAGKIGRETVHRMTECYGSVPEDIRAVIGPSICRNCYEISEDVALCFREAFPGQEERILREKHPEGVRQGTADRKYLLDLWEANRLVLREAGLPDRNIETGGLCTCCNPAWMFSHRGQGEERGNNGAFLMLADKE